MAEKELKGRFLQKTDSTENWEKAKNFRPYKGEIIVYQDGDTSKFKVGDGKTLVGDLPFAVGEVGENENQVGKATETGGEIFNDYDTNKAYTEFSHSEGKSTSAGTKGFNITETYIDLNKIVVKNSSDGVSAYDSYSVGDILQFDASQHLYNKLKITSMSKSKSNGGSTNIIFEKLTTEELDLTLDSDPNENFVWVAGKPYGDVFPMARATHAEGESTMALGRASHAEGRLTKAIGGYSHAEGRATEASYGAHSEGYSTKANGQFSHSEGCESIAEAQASHAEGFRVKAIGHSSHAEGQDTQALTNQAHAEGFETIAEGHQSHAEGYATTTKGRGAHSEGIGTKANGEGSHAEGNSSVADGKYAHAEGNNTVSSGFATHAEGEGTNASGNYTHAEGYQTESSSWYSHAEGVQTHAINYGAHAEGYNTTASGQYTHAEGQSTQATGNRAHSEGHGSKAEGEVSHAEGYSTVASGLRSHAEGSESKATNAYAHAEGNGSEASGNTSHAEGHQSKATAYYSHAQNLQTTASGTGSHAEGEYSKATAEAAHAEGFRTEASGLASHTEGHSTKATEHQAHAEGYNTQALGEKSHSEGESTKAIGARAHAEGCNTIAGKAELSYLGFNGIYDSPISNPNAKLIGVEIKLGTINGVSIGDQLILGGIAPTNENVEYEFNILQIDMSTNKVQISQSDYMTVLSYDSFTNKYAKIKNKPYVGNKFYGNNSHAGGLGTIASEDNQTAIGQYNAIDENALFIVGNGESADARSNAFTVNKDGTAYANNQKLATEEYVNSTKPDIATYSTPGLVKIGQYGTHGINITASTGLLSLAQATEENIDYRVNYKPITPNNLDYAVKSGLAANTLEWTNEEQAAAREQIGVETATYNKLGLVTIASTYNGLSFNNGALNVYPAQTSHIDGRNSSCPITPTNLDYAVKQALINPLNTTWTEEEKASVRDLLGVNIEDALDAIIAIQEDLIGGNA